MDWRVVCFGLTSRDGDGQVDLFPANPAQTIAQRFIMSQFVTHGSITRGLI
jgi:hypothetical protein